MFNTSILSNRAATFLHLYTCTAETIQELPDHAQTLAGRTLQASHSVYATLTSERSIRRYKAALWFCKEISVITWMVCVALWFSLKEWCDAEVDRHTAKPELVEPEQSAAVHIPRQPKTFQLAFAGDVHEFGAEPIALLPTAPVKPQQQKKTKRNRRGV